MNAEAKSDDIKHERANNLSSDFELKKFGDYEIQALLGTGAYATVYLAKDKLDRPVALKILKKQYAFDDDFVRNFRREASMAARLNHENIIQIYDQDEIEGQFFIAMEHAPGGTLRSYIEDQETISLAELKSFVQQIANALDVAHQDNVVHRDIKPSNVLLGYNNKIKLADFGIARAAMPGTERLSTAIQGTADYMAPEQADPSTKVDGRVDVYSFAVVVYEMLSSGSLPFSSRNRADFVDLIHQKRTAKPTSIEDVPTNVTRTIEQALHPDPDLRFRSAGDFATELIKAIRVWEQSTALRKDKRDLSGMAILAMEQQEWQAAKDYWEEVLKIGDSLVARSNLMVVERELNLQDAWAKVEESFDKAKWTDALTALTDIKKLDPDNKEAPSRREEAELQLEMQQLYEEGDDAFAKEDYAVAVGKFEAIYTKIPDYRDVAERLEEVRKNRVKEELNRLREKALVALIEADKELAYSTEKEISKRAPQGEYGIESFLERFKELSSKLKQERLDLGTTVTNCKESLKIKTSQLQEQIKRNQILEADLKQTREQLEQIQHENIQLRQELEDRLLAYFTDLQEMVGHLDSRLIKTSTIREYTNQLRERIRDIATRGRQLESSLAKNNTETRETVEDEQ